MTRHKENNGLGRLYDLKGLEGNKAFIILIRKALIGTWQSLVSVKIPLRSFSVFEKETRGQIQS